MVEKEVRTSVETISSTSETRRSHMMPRLTASKVCLLIESSGRSAEIGDEVVAGIDAGGVAGGDHAGALALLDQGRAGNGRARQECIAVVDRPIRQQAALRVVSGPRALARLCRRRSGLELVARAQIRRRSGGFHLPV